MGHLVSNISRLQGSWDPSLEKRGPESPKEVEVTSLQESLWAECFYSLEIILVGPIAEVSIMIKAKILQLGDQYKFLNTFHVHVPGWRIE